MRIITSYEKRQRGCQYCTDVATNPRQYGERTACPHVVCPFGVLEKYRSYEDYMKSDDCKLLVGEFFKSVSGFYECPKRNYSPRKLHSDGMHKVDY